MRGNNEAPRYLDLSGASSGALQSNRRNRALDTELVTCERGLDRAAVRFATLAGPPSRVPG